MNRQAAPRVISDFLIIGLTGGIFQGTGTPTSPTTALKIYNSGGVGIIEMWKAGAKTFYSDSSGNVLAGGWTIGATTISSTGVTITSGTSASIVAGSTTLDANGISVITNAATTTLTKAYRIVNGTDVHGYLGGYHTVAANGHSIYLEAQPLTGQPASLVLVSNGGAGQTGNIQISAGPTGGSYATIQMNGQGDGTTTVAINCGLSVGGSYAAANGAINLKEITAPGAPGADIGTLYLDDNGAGKTRLNIRFATGAVQVLATQP